MSEFPKYLAINPITNLLEDLNVYIYSRGIFHPTRLRVSCVVNKKRENSIVSRSARLMYEVPHIGTSYNSESDFP